MKRGSNSLGTNLMLSVGPYFANYGSAFEGDIEQLSISEDPQQAERQCHFQTGDHFELIKDDNGNNNGGGVITTTTVNPQKDTKTARPVAVTCRVPCQNGGTCNESGMCACPLGYTGDSCQSALCSTGCQNGGICSHPGHCKCFGNFTGNFCETPVCSPPCVNSGQCIGNNQCACPYGSVGQDCQPFCRQGCHNGGCVFVMTSVGVLKATPASRARRLFAVMAVLTEASVFRPIAVLARPTSGAKTATNLVVVSRCRNGGTCVAPNVCACTAGYWGPRCKKYKCDKKCRNGGKVRGPQQVRLPDWLLGSLVSKRYTCDDITRHLQYNLS
ncbi:wnt inhibitory factor 1-like [Pomacea canaliculata]|uniref:wnt inhibitory factor 1-like n=1 Tax=Pomacea canaliculata TaxID=400727 RepID=UPI000D726F47|nr:wnt inhibitory factor 1-like [Pomacea canaliculata]